MNDDAWALENFTGVTRLFPLPNLVMFPHVVQPLHIFEPRYRQMTADALADDRLLTLCLLRPEIMEPSDLQPPIFPVGCLCRIVAEKCLPDGRYLLLVRGLSRVRIMQELGTDRPYRVARAVPLPDEIIMPVGESRRLRQRLADLILPRFVVPSGGQASLREMFEGEMPLGPLCDCLAYQLPLEIATKQSLLAEPDVAVRATALIDTLRSMKPLVHAAPAPRKFPPDFSLN
jgi:Lon protease-like protein